MLKYQEIFLKHYNMDKIEQKKIFDFFCRRSIYYCKKKSKFFFVQFCPYYTAILLKILR